MHRGSSKDASTRSRPSETLPLSASPLPVDVIVEIARAGTTRSQTISVPHGTLLREAVRPLAGSPEGYAVLLDGVPVPLDLPIDRPMHLVVVPTFSGG
jgi:sulfur carrier protein ThiS